MPPRVVFAAESPADLKSNLDLPYNAVAGFTDEEEDVLKAPEVVTFYGLELEGDGFFFVIDASGSMQNGPLEEAKREVLRNIDQFPEEVEFGVVFFNTDFTRFLPVGEPAQATEAGKEAAREFVSEAVASSLTCAQSGLVAGLRLASRSSAERKVLVFLGDGDGNCPGVPEKEYLEETLALVRDLNYQRVVIHTVGVLDIQPLGEEFLKALAAENGGTYRRIAE